MIVALAIGLALTVGGLVFLSFVLAGALRAMDDLRRRLDAVGAAGGSGGDHIATGLAAGEAAPPFEGPRIDRGRFSSESLRGARHLIAFADPDCAACAELVPALLHDSPLPGVVVSDGPTVPPAWRPPDDGRVALVVDGSAIAERYATELRPSVFVVDQAGRILGSAPAGTLGEVGALIRDAIGVRIAAAPSEAGDG
jgi:hypothetical protein